LPIIIATKFKILSNDRHMSHYNNTTLMHSKLAALEAVAEAAQRGSGIEVVTEVEAEAPKE
jgi:hypothetical protein